MVFVSFMVFLGYNNKNIFKWKIFTFIMDVKEIGVQVNEFVNFINLKLNNFASLSLGEKISYPVAGLGTILILISLILFVL